MKTFKDILISLLIVTLLTESLPPIIGHIMNIKIEISNGLQLFIGIITWWLVSRYTINKTIKINRNKKNKNNDNLLGIGIIVISLIIIIIIGIWYYTKNTILIYLLGFVYFILYICIYKLTINK